MQALQQLLDIHADPHDYARRWKQRTGGKVVGCLGLDIPEEMILACGMLPVQIQADPQASLTAVAPYCEGSSGPILSSLTARLLDGTYDYLDYLVIASRPAFYSEIYAFLRELKKAKPELVRPDITLVDFHHENRDSTHQFNQQVVSLFRSQLEVWSGHPVSASDTGQAIARTNHIRRLIEQLNALRRQHPPKLCGSEALAIMSVAFLMDRVEYITLLERWLAEAEQLLPVSGAPVIYSGSDTDTLQTYRSIEAGGVVIIADDQNNGSRRFEGQISETGNPQEALLQYYWHRAPSPSAFHTSQRAEYLQLLCSTSTVQGVVFHILAVDHPSAWDFPVLRDTLSAKKMAYLALTQQPYQQHKADDITRQVADFAATLKP